VGRVGRYTWGKRAMLAEPEARQTWLTSLLADLWRQRARAETEKPKERRRSIQGLLTHRCLPCLQGFAKAIEERNPARSRPAGDSGKLSAGRSRSFSATKRFWTDCKLSAPL
jgi:hypothetical protein